MNDERATFSYIKPDGQEVIIGVGTSQKEREEAHNNGVCEWDCGYCYQAACDELRPPRNSKEVKFATDGQVKEATEWMLGKYSDLFRRLAKSELEEKKDNEPGKRTGTASNTD